MPEPKPCPFCGGDSLKVQSKSERSSDYTQYTVYRRTYSVRCNCCHARGPAFGGLVVYGKIDSDFSCRKWITTDKDLEKAAVDAWNNRLGERGRR